MLIRLSELSVSSGSLGPNYIIDHRFHASGAACYMRISAAIYGGRMCE